MRQLGTALHLYAEDNNGCFPSSGRGVDDVRFETTMGNPRPGARGTWPEVLFKYAPGWGVYLCPSDFRGQGVDSYCYKHAVNLASKAGYSADNPYGSRQILLYEREPFHSGRGPIVEGSTLNALRVDGHASTIQITDVAPDREPRYFNYLDKSSREAAKAKKPYWNPYCCYDSMFSDRIPAETGSP